MSAAIGAARRRAGAAVFIWLGAWSAMHGARLFAESPVVLGVAPVWMRAAAPYVSVGCAYLSLVPSLLAFASLTRGLVRPLLRASAALALAIGIIGVLVFAASGSTSALMPYENILASCLLLILIVTVASPSLAVRYSALNDPALANSRRGRAARQALRIGMLVFAVETLYNNFAGSLGFTPRPILDQAGFAALLFSLAYVAIEVVFANERRLHAVDQELDIARKIQLATLPSEVPAVPGLCIGASYRPMTAVAGDFYTFVHDGPARLGVLVADATGHGVPAALIASMIKVAARTVSSSADDPAAVLAGVNRLLTGESPGQLVSAAYLWIDPGRGVARYSAAGHPPLLRWTRGRLERIESNGFLLGMADDGGYPVFDLALESGDRFLLYTDGVTDVENARGEFFGDGALEETVRTHAAQSSATFCDELLSAVDRWRSGSVPQQDDMTVVAIDVT